MYKYVFILCVFVLCSSANSQCRDPVVLVHGNGGSSSDWDNTYQELIDRGYNSTDIFIPEWGSSCVVCNNHSGSEELPVENAITNAIIQSCTGKIDVIGHSMGVTLSMKQIIDLDISSYINDFVGIAGGVRGLKSCGYYPFNVFTSTCGYWGFSVGSPFLNSLDQEPIAENVYSIKSWIDQVVCYGGCTIGGVHSSTIWNEDASFNFLYDHFGLQSNTSVVQVDLVE